MIVKALCSDCHLALEMRNEHLVKGLQDMSVGLWGFIDFSSFVLKGFIVLQ